MAAQDFGDHDPLGRGAIFMLTHPAVMFLFGIILGFLSGLGVGGGSLLMLLLTLGIGLEYSLARTVNLLFFMPGAIIASLFRCRQVKLPVKKLFGAMVAGCISALCFSYLSIYIDVEFIKKVFGVLLLFTGIRELSYRERKAK